jgi:hypothetical protein
VIPEGGYQRLGEALLPKPKPLKKRPSTATMYRWLDTGKAKTACGCWVEVDGHCPHGRPSLLLVFGVV